MTVFEQHVDLHQVATEPTLLGCITVTLVVGVVFIAIFMFMGNLIDGKGKNVAQKIGLLFGAVAVICIVTGIAGLGVATLTLNNTVTAQPLATSGASSKNNSRPLLADKYREEINAGIADKLGDYTIDNVNTDNDSVLTGGYSNADITAHRDGKNYRLRPEWDFDKNTSTVKITVDVEELPFNRTNKE